MNKQDLQSDLGYVRELVQKSDRDPSGRGLYLLWAVIILIGFSMVDLAPRYVGFFWMVAGPLGGILSGIIGSRHSRNRGQVNRAVGIRHALHWIGMFVVIGFAVLMTEWAGQPQLLGKIILLIVTFGWWTAGVHFDRAFLTLGIIMALGFLAVLFIAKYAWVGLAIVLAAELIRLAVRKGGVDAGQEN